LNHTTLTLEPLAARNRKVAGLIIGAWPARPDEIEQSNRSELGRLAPLLGTLPAGAGALEPEAFRSMTAHRLQNITTGRVPPTVAQTSRQA
jgi:dethiobiotin synthetase